LSLLQENSVGCVLAHPHTDLPKDKDSVRANAHPVNFDSDAFVEALDHYLKGDYDQAHRILGELIARNDRDADARLMLATLLRHVGRIDEALEELDRLTKLEDAVKWEWEIREERRRITELQTRNGRAREVVSATSDLGKTQIPVGRAA